MKILKISKNTFDVLNTDNKNMSYSSQLASHSIYNVVNVTKGSGLGSVSVTHGLGFVPKVWVFVEGSDAGGTYIRRVPWDTLADAIDYYITTTQIVIECQSTATAYNFRVIIFTRSPTV